MSKIGDSDLFNKFALHPLQTWEWGEFRQQWGNEIERFQIGKNTERESIQIIFSKIPKTKYVIGTLLKGLLPTKELIDKLKEISKKNNAIFIKLEPNITFSKKQNTNLKRLGLIEGKTLFTPTTFWIDLTKSEDELLKSFHPKTRYNINYAKKHGVTVVEDNSDKAFEKYLALTRETVGRQGFFSHTEKYHRLMWHHLHTSLILNHKSPIARLLVAKYNGEVITAWIVFVWKDFIYYPYGASTDRYKNTQSNSLMMWEAIRLGRNLKLKTFDLWGREEGKGFTRFKEGFSPLVVEFLGSWDLPINKNLYSAYRSIENLRWKLLRLINKFTKPSF